MMIREGAIVRVRGGGKDGRTGVVLRVLERTGRLFVPWGTGTSRPEKRHVVVEPHTTNGKALGIYKTTFFYADNVTICAPGDVELMSTLCPPMLSIALQELYGA